MLTLVLLSVMQFPAVVFDMSHGQESDLLGRYARTLGVEVSGASSAASSFALCTTEQRAQEILKTFGEEFGVLYKPTFPSSITKDLAYPFSAKLEPKPGIDGLAVYDHGSLLLKAYLDLIRLEPKFAQDRILECRYCLRPWITSGFKRTQTISVIFTFLDHDKEVDFRITYDPR